MTRLLCGVLLGFTLATVASVRAQDSISVHSGVSSLGQYQDKFIWAGTVPTAPTEHDLTVREIIDILTDYDVYHAKQQPFFRPAFGVTNFESDPPSVWIFQTGDTDSKRSTVIHELMHIHYHKLGLNPDEDFISSEELRQYLKLFGEVK